MKPTRLKGIYEHNGNLFTVNAVPKQSVYGERLFFFKGTEYRQWDPTRSKLGAGIKKGASQIGIKPGVDVLYLGCSTGTTVSHVAEIAQKVYAVDIAPRVLRELYFLSQKRKNIVPIFADANIPGQLTQYIKKVDVLFMDIAQRNQVEIFLKNLMFVKEGGFALLALKARSVDVAKKPRAVFEQARQELEKHITIVDKRILDPFETDHMLFICKK